MCERRGPVAALIKEIARGIDLAAVGSHDLLDDRCNVLRRGVLVELGRRGDRRVGCLFGALVEELDL
jgi:hypothetical protein